MGHEPSHPGSFVKVTRHWSMTRGHSIKDPSSSQVRGLGRFEGEREEAFSILWAFVILVPLLLFFTMDAWIAIHMS